MKKWVLNGIVIAIFLLVFIQGVHAEETVVKPVVVVLDMDTTPNMFSNPDPPYISRHESAKAAVTTFLDQMNDGQDHIGLNSFGSENNQQFDLPPQTSITLVKDHLDLLVKGTSGKGFASSITESMTNIMRYSA